MHKKRESPAHSTSFLQEIKKHQRDAFRTLGPAGIVTVIGFVITFFFIEPAPPRSLVIATGPEDGNYYKTGLAYAEFLKEKGIDLQVRETAGSLENFDLLMNDDNVDIAIVQGGAAPVGLDKNSVESLASLYLEPIWIFHRPSLELASLRDFSKLRISIGDPGSGTQALAKLLFEENGVSSSDGFTRFVSAGATESVEMLHRGEVDAIVLVLAPQVPIIRQLLLEEKYRLFDFERQDAYSKRFGFLESISLGRGVIDLELDLPRTKLNLIAPYANLVATPSLHDALIPLLLDAATSEHFSGGLLVKAGELPSLIGSEFGNNDVAREYINHGPSLFQRHLNFWVASLIDRAKIMLIPLIALLFPLIKLAPPIYRWRIRSRIYRWYAILKGMDQGLLGADAQELKRFEVQLLEMESELSELDVPLSYMQEFYNLHLHIDLVKRRLRVSERNISDPPSGRATIG